MLEAKQLTKNYNGQTALKSVSFTVNKGDIFCLLGANGAGKTTAINLFLNFIQPTGGQALINGLDVTTHSLETKRHLAYIPESLMLYPNLSGLENLAYFTGLSGKKHSTDELQNALADAGLQNDAHSKRVSAYSKFGTYYNGNLSTTTGGLRIALIPNIALTAEYEYNNFKQVGIEESNLETHLITGGLRLAYDADIQASVFYQYNSFDEKGRWNIRASWQFAPLSFVYLVFNETSFTNSPVMNQSVIGKVTLLQQF
jgi:energy-coupling factor transporter ATP-binding protein EcfA2